VGTARVTLLYKTDQITLYAGDGNIDSGKGVTYFTFSTIHMESVVQAGLVLCGFNIKN